MDIETIRSNTLKNQAWLERALLVLDKKNLWHNEVDAKMGTYIANWVRKQRTLNIPLGNCITGDQWTGKARHLVNSYAKELLILSYEKAKADLVKYKELADNTRKKIKQIGKVLKDANLLGPKEPPKEEPPKEPPKESS